MEEMSFLEYVKEWQPFIETIATIIIAICGAIATYFCSYLPRIRKQKINSLNKELLGVYKDLALIRDNEQRVCEEYGESLKSFRDGGLGTSKYSTPSNITKRIEELESIVDK